MLVSTIVAGFSITSPSQQIGRIRTTTTTTLLQSTASTSQKDTPVVLPEFNSREEYIQYMESVAALPQGFATGTADGTFVSVEAPGLGKLPIRATVIYLPDGPTDNWAAVYTSNKVRTKKNF